MNRFAAALAAIALTTAAVGCAVIPTGQPAAVSTIAGKKALYVAESAFIGANLAAESAVDAGLLRGEAAGRVDVGLVKAHQALVAARAAEKIGDASSYAEQVALAQDLVATIWPMIPAKKGL